MREEIQLLLNLIQDAINQETPKKITYEGLDWQVFEKLVSKNQLKPLLLNPLLLLAHDQCIDMPQEQLKRWKQESFQSTINEYKKQYQLKKIIEAGKREQVQFIVFKGCVLADLYPKYTLRTSCDSDLLVEEKNCKKASKVLMQLNYEIYEQDSKEKVTVFIEPITKHMVELHVSLWEDFEGEKINRLNQMELAKESTLITLHLNNLSVTTLGYEEHLIYQMVHIIKHFTLQGIGIRYLVDVTLYIKKYGQFIDYRDFWIKMDELGFGEFCEKFFSIGMHYFGLSSEIMGNRISYIGLDYEALLTDLIDVGICFDEKGAGWQILGIMTPYFCDDDLISSSKLGRKMRVLFPKSWELSEEYRYATKVKILLPIAWVHRYIAFLIKWCRNRQDWYTAKEKLEVAQHRLELIKSLGIAQGRKSK